MRSLKYVPVVGALFQFAAGHPRRATANPPTVNLSDDDTLIGLQTTVAGSLNTVNQFLGIPFAARPERFSVPVKPGPVGVYNATEYGSTCIQQFVYPLAVHNFTIAYADNPPLPESEDCLYLNVWVPSTPPPDESGYAVMFWIYGGSDQYGSGSDLYYSGSGFAANQGVILVTSNYRMNVFGFPNSPEIPLNEQNIGFLDQRMALNWVQEHISKFGGDPKKVTIFGESAGAGAVDELITTTPENPPFWAAILESGQASLSQSRSRNSTSAWEILVSALNCSGASSQLACVRTKDMDTIRDIEEKMILNFRPVSDNITQLEFPDAARRARRVANVPILAGTNYQEGRFFELGQTNISAFLNSTFPGRPQLQAQVATSYPLGQPNMENAYEVISAIETDYGYLCPAALVGNITSNAGYKYWRYLFNASFPNTRAEPDIGVYHSSEIAVVFGTYPKIGATSQQAALSAFMQKTWASFAKNPQDGPGWPALGTNGGVDLGVIGANGSAGVQPVDPAPLEKNCGLYASIYASAGA